MLTLYGMVGAGHTLIAGMLYALICHPHNRDLKQRLNLANKPTAIFQ